MHQTVGTRGGTSWETRTPVIYRGVDVLKLLKWFQLVGLIFVKTWGGKSMISIKDRQQQTWQHSSANHGQVCSESRSICLFTLFLSRRLVYFKKLYFLYPYKRSRDIFWMFLTSFMVKWPVAHLRSSKCQQSPHCDIFKKCPPAAFIITNSKVKRRAISRKAQIQSTVSRKSFNFYNVCNFSRLGGKNIWNVARRTRKRREKTLGVERSI